MATTRDKKHDLYLKFHGNLPYNGDFSEKEKRVFTWFMITCVVGVIAAYWIF
jgi:hypothetical protein